MRGGGNGGGTVVAIGMFDGVHRGHREVLAQLRAHGSRLGLSTVVLTFDPHPRALLRPEAAPALLVPLEQRIELLHATGCVDRCVVLPFDRARSQEPVEDFVDGTLCAELDLRALVVGADFACGRGRQGTVERLAALGRQRGFEVLPVALQSVAAVPGIGRCSSSATRALIQRGEVAAAARLLDRPVEFRCTIDGVGAGGQAWADAAIPPGLCTPPPARYIGAVSHPGGQGGWRSAELQLREDTRAGRRWIRFPAAGHAARGDRVALRLLGPGAG